jgi:hypothetical protein
MGSKRTLTTTHHPQVDGQTEILNQTLEVAIRAFTNSKHNNWSELLPYLAFAYNNTPHTTTKFTPAYLLYGFQPHTHLKFLHSQDPVARPSEFKFDSIKAQEFVKGIESVRLITKDSLHLAQAQFEQSYNKSHIPILYEPGNKVLVNIHSLQLPESKGPGVKFSRQFDGQFEVTERVSPVVYHIQLPHSYSIHPILSITHLKPFKESETKQTDLLQLCKSIEEYEVQEIVDQKRIKYSENCTCLLYQC